MRSVEFSVVQYDESPSMIITVFSFSFKIPFRESLDGFAYGISFDKMGWNIEKNDVTSCYYWKKILKSKAKPTTPKEQDTK